MSEKPSAAEQAFEEWFTNRPWDQSVASPVEAYNRIAREAYLAATERTARRCVEIVNEQWEYGAPFQDCHRAIAKEFGLD